MPFTYTIRLTKAEDLHEVWLLDVKSFPMPWPESSFRYDFYQNDHARMWVAEANDENGDPIIIASMVAWMIIDEAHLGTIAVHPDYRGRGVGEAMMHTLIANTRQEGALKIDLEVRKSNLAAQALYRKFGFVVEGERKRYYSDNHEDALLMGLCLPSDDD